MYTPGEGMIGCWFKKECVSVDVWSLGVFVLRRPEATGAPAVVMAGLDSVFDCVRCGFMKWARGSNPDVSSCEASRAGPETGTGGTNGGFDWTI